MTTLNANLTAISSSQVRRLEAMYPLTPTSPIPRISSSAVRVTCNSSSAAAPHSRARASDTAANWLTAAVDWAASDINRLVVLAQSTTKAAVPAIEQAMDEVWERESKNQRQQLLQNSSKVLRSKLAKVSTWKRDAAPARKEALKSDLETLRSLLRPKCSVGTSPVIVTGPTRSYEEAVKRLNETLGADIEDRMVRSFTSPAARCEWPKNGSTMSLLSSITDASARCAWPRGMQSPGFSATLEASPRCQWPRSSGAEHLSFSVDRQMNALGALSAFQETMKDGPRCPWPRTDKTSSRVQPTKAISSWQVMAAAAEYAASCPWPRALARVRAVVVDGAACGHEDASLSGPRCSWPRK